MKILFLDRAEFEHERINKVFLASELNFIEFITVF